ncbi:hypothetical protein [Pedobacter jeongneungensis]|uniref:hypothetical protein n=1 Tax=Pedobacter jeongneungensis TaxID=947309 RepID=UPI000468DDF7|nr:hypothetical protein [Pedobacter jeongneungensis]
MGSEPQFTVKAYSKKELQALYNVTAKTFRAWIEPIVDLGSYKGRKYTPAQVEKLVYHLGKP